MLLGGKIRVRTRQGQQLLVLKVQGWRIWALGLQLVQLVQAVAPRPLQGDGVSGEADVLANQDEAQ